MKRKHTNRSNKQTNVCSLADGVEYTLNHSTGETEASRSL